jgi:hypothetical protein
MPAMPRPKGKATQIAWSLIGKPDNMVKKTAREKRIDRIINSDKVDTINH